MKTVDFNDAFFKANLLYGLDGNYEDMEELGLIAWGKINSPLFKTYRIIGEMNKDSLKFTLPCNCDEIIAVTRMTENWQRVNSETMTPNYIMSYYEEYSEANKDNVDPLYIPGEFIKYEQVQNELHFTQYFKKFRMLYRGYILDDEGLPLITEAQSFAIAAFLAWTAKYKEGYSTMNSNIIQFAEMLERKWRTAAAQAKITGPLNQNDMDRILNVTSSWNRKSFNKSFKSYT